MKKVLLAFCVAATLTGPVQGAREIWVSPAGSDGGSGNREQPLATPHMALRMARELRRLQDPSADGGIRIILREGVYRLAEPLIFRPEDSGTHSSPTVVMAAPGEQPVLSGGVPVVNWTKAARLPTGMPRVARGKVWVADIPREGGLPAGFRQLWINGKKALRASTLGDGPLPRILSVDRKNEILRIPAPAVEIADPGQAELVIHQWWAIANLRILAIRTEGDSAAVTFRQPESRIEFEHPWPAPYIDTGKNRNGNSAFYLANAPELLNQPGEWYADPGAGKVWYWPEEGQEMTRAEAVIPRMETLVRLTGSADLPVTHVHFRGIGLEHTGWMRPSQAGHVPVQAGFYLLDAYKLAIPGTPDKAGLENLHWVGRQPAAVEIRYAGHLLFHRCDFRRMAATGLDLVAGSFDSLVEGCTFRDIGGTALQAGYFGDEGFESHRPWDPSDSREVCRHLTFSDNLISNATNEDWGCVGIGVGYARDITISHNEIGEVNYSGISLGWGWTKTVNCMRNNRIHANHIHHFARQMYDVGGIYTLSAQPNTVISENYIHDLEKAPYAHIPTHYQYIYLDEGSSYIRILDNLTEADKFFSNTPGPGNEWNNNGPHTDRGIAARAGIRAAFRDIAEKP